MGKTINIRKAIRTKLLTYNNTVYYNRAHGTTPDTYLIFSLDLVTSEETMYQYELEVNVIGKGTDSSTIEDLADNIWAGLDHWLYLDSVNMIAFDTYQETINIVNEEDESIIRRRLTFTMRVCGG